MKDETGHIRKCAAGQLASRPTPPSFEGRAVTDLPPDCDPAQYFLVADFDFLHLLQTTHDEAVYSAQRTTGMTHGENFDKAFFIFWKEELKKLADEWGLNPAVLSEIPTNQ